MAKLFANSEDPDQMPHLIWGCTVCKLPFWGLQTKTGFKSKILVQYLKKKSIFFLNNFDLTKFLYYSL